MIAVDTNILVYAHRAETPLHTVALARLKQLAADALPWAIPVFCVGEFVRVVTHPRIFDPPSPLDVALAAVDALVAAPSVRLLLPGQAFPAHFAACARAAGAAGNLVFDAQIAAVCREHGVDQLLTADRDFARFADVTVVTLD